MEPEHYIQWIELIVDDKVYRQMLAPRRAPEAEFCVEKGSGVYAREYCNVHGLWKG
jgi:superoxide reductase